tara:strand:+ start:1334 stop:2221 length:888 start_codon:yes stop_codon:yes gene_type:complete
MRKTNVIIFGHTGYVGKNLFNELSLKKFQNKIKIYGISTKQLDLTKNTSSKFLKKKIGHNSIIVICSAIKSNYGSSLHLMQKNVDMVKNIIKAIEKKKLKKIIFVSSKAVYGVHKKFKKPIDEKSPVDPDTYYSLSKVISEKMLKLGLNKHNVKKLVIFRPSIIYGANEDLIAGSPSGFFNLIFKDDTVQIWGDGSEIRNFLFVKDFTRILIKFIFNNKFGDFNVGGFNSSYINLIKVISKFLNKKAVIFRKKRTTPKINKIFLKTKILRADPSLKFTSLAETLKDLKSARDKNY